MCVYVTVHMSTCVPVNGPGGHVVRDVSGVCVPVPAGQLFDLQSEVPQWGGPCATRHPVEAEMARFNPVLRNSQLPGWLGTLCGCGEDGELGRGEMIGEERVKVEKG